METKLAAEQPPEKPERDPLVEQTAAPPADDSYVEPAPTMRDLSMMALMEVAARSVEAAFDAHEKRCIAGGASPDEAAEAIAALTPVTVLLPARFLEYLTMRAAIHGEEPGQHLEGILRQFRSYFDDKRPELTAMEAQRNGGAVTRRVA